MYNDTIYRFKEIVKVLAYYGFGYLINTKFNSNKSSPENLRSAFEELGPTFIKIGEILSVRPDIVSALYIEELQRLKDAAPVEPYENISKIFYEEFLGSIDNCFLYFDKTPFTVTSAFQIHDAILKDGREVTVKIQRPDFLEKIRADIAILNRLIRFTKGSFSDILFNPEDAFSEVLSSVEQELDFNNEAQNIDRFRTLNGDIAFLHLPYVIWNLSTSKIITQEKTKGFMINDTKHLKNNGYSLEDLGKKLTLCYFKQIFKDGFFHGDPRPENLLIDGGTICIKKFSTMGTLNKALKAALNQSIASLIFKDIDKLMSVLMSVGIKKGQVNRHRLYEALQGFMQTHLSISLSEIKLSILLQELLKVADENNLSLPKDFTIFIRCIVLLEEVVSGISLEMKLLDFTISFFKSSNNPLISTETDLNELLIHSFDPTKNQLKLPSRLTELIDSMISGKTKLQLEVRNLNKLIVSSVSLSNRIVICILSASMLISSSIILSSSIEPKLYVYSILGFSILAAALIMILFLIISILKSK